MICKHLNTSIINSRPYKDSPLSRRRHECKDCGFRFTTHESREYDSPKLLQAKIRKLETKLRNIEKIIRTV